MDKGMKKIILKGDFPQMVTEEVLATLKNRFLHWITIVRMTRGFADSDEDKAVKAWATILFKTETFKLEAD